MNLTPDSEEFRFLPLAESDLVMLHRWLMRSHVREWWAPGDTVESLRQDYLVNPGGTQAYIAWFGNAQIGFIQSYVVMGSGDGWWEDETDPGARGIDQFLANIDHLGQGLGSSMIRAFIDKLFSDPAVTVVQTDPHPRNARAIRCYEKAGFKAIAQVATPDGEAMLMRCERPQS
jgi:RimJ/RimL family protein N-acetyltransferase